MGGLRDQLRERAARQNAHLPQYDGTWNGPEWRVVRFRRRVRTKLGVAFEPGDYALLREGDADDEARGLTFPRAYSERNRISTAVPPDSYREVE